MKSKKALIFYFLISIILWQLCISVSKILTGPFMTGKNADFYLFSITQTTNKGAAFGMFQNNVLLLAILGIIMLICVCFYVYKFVKFEDKIKILYCSVFSAGVIGNTYERIAHGHVFDFIKLNFINFPVFNLFDVLICISVALYIFYYIKEEKNEN